jgi:diacylglycerol kinase family enzyme
MPNDPVRATVGLATAIAARRHTNMNLGKIDERLFLFSAGVGFDGQVMKRVEQKRKGRRPSDLSHVGIVMGMFTNERFVFDERMTVQVNDTGEELRAGLLMVGNTSPLSYVGRIALNFMPDCRLEKGLDFMAPKRVNVLFAMRNSMQAMGFAGKRTKISAELGQIRGDLDSFDVFCDEPQPCQVDGEYIGDRTHIRFRCLRDAIRLVY